MDDRWDVAVIGAGAAGIAAAAALHRAGRSVVLLEATGRIGGRAHTETIDAMPLDLGCGWLHSAERNPLTELAATSGFTVDRTEAAWGRQYRDLGFSAADRQAARAAFAAFHDRLARAPAASDRAADMLGDGGWDAYIEALSGYMNGAGLGQLSIADYLAYEDAASDVNWRIREGYGSFIASRLPPVPAMFGLPVTRIGLGSRDVTVETGAGALRCGAAIVTVSTNVLAAATIRFEPAADAHLHAAACLPLGLAEKLFLGLADGHGLASETHLIGDPRRAATGSYYIRPFGRPVIEAFVGGPGAVALDRAGQGAAFAFAIDELAALLGNAIRAKLVPLAASRWARCTHVRGSYSHALPGHADRRTMLATPIDGRLFFAGEATHRTDFSTAHGAWESGERAAAAVLATDR